MFTSIMASPLVGTHTDKLEKESCKERIAVLNDRLTTIDEERDCKFAVLPAENGILFPVDNTTALQGIVIVKIM